MIAVIIAAVIAVFLVISALTVVPQMNNVLTAADQMVAEAEIAMTGVNNIVKNADALIEENTETVGNVLKEIEKIDFESLNKSIKSLSEILEPIAGMTSIWK